MKALIAALAIVFAVSTVPAHAQSTEQAVTWGGLAVLFLVSGVAELVVVTGEVITTDATFESACEDRGGKWQASPPECHIRPWLFRSPQIQPIGPGQ